MAQFQTQRVCPTCGSVSTTQRAICDQCGQLAVSKVTQTTERRGIAASRSQRS